MKTCSTRQAANKLGISFSTMNRYIAQKKIPVPELIEVGNISARLWSDAEIERLRELLPQIPDGRKMRKKKQLAISAQQLAKTKPKKKTTAEGGCAP